VLPEGGSRVNVVNDIQLCDYVEKNVSFWFEHINGFSGFGRSTHNLCLVTGCDKARSWGVASFSNPHEEQEISIKFSASSVGFGCSYTWSTYSSASVRASDVGVDAEGKPRHQNHCPFIRGYNLSKRPRRIAKGSRICVSDVMKVRPKGLGVPSKKSGLSGKSFTMRSPIVSPTTEVPPSSSVRRSSPSSALPNDSNSNASSTVSTYCSNSFHHTYDLARMTI